MADQQNITLTITKDEALVLFEFLARFNETDHPDIFEDQAEQRILWDIECLLNQQLAEPFRSDYKNILNEARNKIRDKE